MCIMNMNAKEYRERQTTKRSILIGDNKGLYTAIGAANPITTRGEKRLTIDKVIMKDHLTSYRVDYYWTNSGHQLADGFTKLSSAGGRVDLLLQAVQSGTIRIVYSEVSGRKEAKEQAYDCHNAFGDNLFPMNIDDDNDHELQQNNPDNTIDGWDKFYFDLF